MVISSEGDQLELFDVAAGPARPRQAVPGFWHVQVRHDQGIIGGIAALIGLTVVFAMGVERGKEFARAERLLLPVRGATAPEEVSPTSEATEGSEPSVTSPVERVQEAPSIDSRQVPAKPSAPKLKVPEPSRYAVQVVTYSRPQLAQRELKRLHEAGEQAFLLERQGQTVLYVGPFASKNVAREKVTALKSRYTDCFMRSL